MITMNRKNLVRVLGVGAAALLAGAAWAQPDRGDTMKDGNPDPLSGPKVESREVPGVDGQFGEGNRGQRRAGDRTPTRMFLGAIRSLESAETPEELRLTEEQRLEIREIAEELRAEMQAFRAEHKDELQAPVEARKRGKAARGAGGPAPEARAGRGPRGPRAGDAPPPPPAPGGADVDDGAAPPPPPPGDEKTRERLAEIMRGAPKPEPYHTRIWAVLSEAQQTVVRERLDQAEEARRDRVQVRPERRRDQQREGVPSKSGERRPPVE